MEITKKKLLELIDGMPDESIIGVEYADMGVGGLVTTYDSFILCSAEPKPATIVLSACPEEYE